MADKTKMPDLWTPRSVKDTQRIYADWADTYETDVAALDYATPDRVAVALAAQNLPLSAPILDFGCGTGLSGEALVRQGFTTLDGTDISPEMLAHAREKSIGDVPLYRRLWLGDPTVFAVKPSDYDAIAATGVISLGAAGPDMLMVLLNALAPGGLLAFSYNDPTIADPPYMAALQDVLDHGTATQVFREHGPHLRGKVPGSDVIILHRL